MDPQIRRRVKVYELNQSSEWVDQGTGQCTCAPLEVCLLPSFLNILLNLPSKFNILSWISPFLQGKEGHYLVVRAEDSNEVLLESKVLLGDVYQKQQGIAKNFFFALLSCLFWRQLGFSLCEDTLIVWTETDSTDLALSFQEAAGCSDVWLVHFRFSCHLLFFFFFFFFLLLSLAQKTIHWKVPSTLRGW